MSYSIQFDDGNEVEVFYLTSSVGWLDFAAWAADFDGPLADFADAGYADDTAELSEAINKAANDQPPDDPGVEQTLATLIELIGVGDSGESIALTDGVNDDEQEQP